MPQNQRAHPEKISPHKGVVALAVLARKAHIFIHVKGDNVLEGHKALLMVFDQLLVGWQGCRTYECRR